MKNLQIIRGAAIAAIAFAGGCNTSSSAVVFPSSSPGAECTGNGQTNLTVCVRVPVSATIASLQVADTLYGHQLGHGAPLFQPSQCPLQGGEHVCVARFAAPAAINDVTVSALGAGTASFPVNVVEGQNSSQSVALGGTVSKIAVVPFLSNKPPCGGSDDGALGKNSCLPLGSSEKLWVVAYDGQGSIIVGRYNKVITLNSSSNLVLSPHRSFHLSSSSEAANGKLTVSWKSKLLQTPSGKIRTTPIKAGADLTASSGAVYFDADPNTSRVAGGPVAVATDGNVYFTVNDEDCHRSGACIGAIGQFSPSDQKIREVRLPDVPGVSQLVATSDGALWMATYQPAGNWNGRLPIIRMKPGSFSSGGLETLPESYGEGSGFIESGGNLWISGCLTTGCQQKQGGQPVVVETTVTGSHSAPLATVSLPLHCAQFGYLGFNVGDIAQLGDSLYVVGLNDGSAPPARGTIWQVSDLHRNPSATCVKGLPANFNPSPYFAQVDDTLYLGIGGNTKSVHWGPQTGFYSLARRGGSVAVSRITSQAGTANHLSQNNGFLYYTTDGERNIRVSGLGTYDIAKNEWNFFPSTTFFGQSGNGVSAVSDGAWFTASGNCRRWKGVCLGRALYLSNWSPIPELTLRALQVGQTATLGIFVNPTVLNESRFRPLNVHSGPFLIRTPPQGESGAHCSIDYTHPRQSLTFVVKGTSAGACLLNITDTDDQRQQFVITTVSGSGSP